MGKGDIRTRRGKIYRGTYGVSRLKKRKKQQQQQQQEKPADGAKSGKADA